MLFKKVLIEKLKSNNLGWLRVAKDREGFWYLIGYAGMGSLIIDRLEGKFLENVKSLENEGLLKKEHEQYYIEVDKKLEVFTSKD